MKKRPQVLRRCKGCQINLKNDILSLNNAGFVAKPIEKTFSTLPKWALAYRPGLSLAVPFAPRRTTYARFVR